MFHNFPCRPSVYKQSKKPGTSTSKLYSLSKSYYLHVGKAVLDLFLSMKASSISADLAKLEFCSQAVKGWFAINNLTLNAGKSDVILIGTYAQLRAANHILEIVVAGANLKPMAAIISLGVTLDSHWSFTARVTAVCKACNFHI